MIKSVPALEVLSKQFATVCFTRQSTCTTVYNHGDKSTISMIQHTTETWGEQVCLVLYFSSDTSNSGQNKKNPRVQRVDIQANTLPIKHEVLPHCWVNCGPTSHTAGQH